MTLLNQLIRDEGERQFAYDDADGLMLVKGMTLKGNLTIGIGRNLSAKGLSKSERELLLSNDIADASRELEIALPWTSGLDEVRRGALVNMVFNEGVAHVAGFHKALAALQAGDWATARNEFLDSAWAKEVGARAQRLAIQIDTGAWQ